MKLQTLQGLGRRITPAPIITPVHTLWELRSNRVQRKGNRVRRRGNRVQRREIVLWGHRGIVRFYGQVCCLSAQNIAYWGWALIKHQGFFIIFTFFHRGSINFIKKPRPTYDWLIHNHDKYLCPLQKIIPIYYGHVSKLVISVFRTN